MSELWEDSARERNGFMLPMVMGPVMSSCVPARGREPWDSGYQDIICSCIVCGISVNVTMIYATRRVVSIIRCGKTGSPGCQHPVLFFSSPSLGSDAKWSWRRTYVQCLCCHNTQLTPEQWSAAIIAAQYTQSYGEKLRSNLHRGMHAQ